MRMGGRVPVRRPSAALATDGRAYANLYEVGVPDAVRDLLDALAAQLGPTVFVGVLVPGLTASRFLAALDDRAAEAIAVARPGHRRRGRVRKS